MTRTRASRPTYVAPRRNASFKIPQFILPVGPNLDHAAGIIAQYFGEGADNPDDMEEAQRCAMNLALERLIEAEEAYLTYCGWGGKHKRGPIRSYLGVSILDVSAIPRHGIRRAVFDAAYGIVNGFEPSAIVYYVLTRSLSPHILHLALVREGKRHLFPWPRGKRPAEV